MYSLYFRTNCWHFDNRCCLRWNKRAPDVAGLESMQLVCVKVCTSIIYIKIKVVYWRICVTYLINILTYKSKDFRLKVKGFRQSDWSFCLHCYFYCFFWISISKVTGARYNRNRLIKQNSAKCHPCCVAQPCRISRKICSYCFQWMKRQKGSSFSFDTC